MATFSNMTIKARLGWILLPAFLGLLFFSFSSVLDKYRVLTNMNNLYQLMTVVEKVSSLTHEVQKERGLSAGFLISKGQKNGSELSTQRQLTDKRASELQAFLSRFDTSKFGSLQASLNEATSQYIKLEAMRGSITHLTAQPKESFTYYSHLAGLFVNVVSQVAVNSRGSGLTAQATAYFNYSQVKEQNGRQRALMNTVFGAGHFEPDTYQQFLIIQAAMDSYNTAFQAFATNEMKDFNKDLQTTQYARDVESMKNIALKEGLSGEFGVDADAWFKATTHKINDMKDVEDKMAAHFLAQAATLASNAKTALMIDVAILAIALALAAFLAIKVSRNLLKQLGGEPEYTASVIRKIADGDLNVQVVLKEGDTSSVLSAIKHMAEKLAQIIGDMRMATDLITKQGNERQKAEAELLRFKNVLDNTLDMIFMFEPESLRFVYVNQGAILSMGYSREELLEMTPVQIKPLMPEPKFRQFIAPLIECEQSSLHFETLHQRKDGTDFPVDIFLQLVKESDGSSLFVAIVRDITEQMQIKAELTLAKEAAEASTRSKSEFLASMSHEIRTPMSGVLGMLGLLEHTPLNESQHQQVRIASRSANSLLSLINDILDFSKVEAGKMDLEMIEFNLCDELEDLAESVAFRAQEKGVELILDTTALTYSNIIHDPGRLRQILVNLLSNALKFTHDGEILIRATMLTEMGSTRLHIEISDTGIGIPSDKIDCLFESFTQADSSTTRKYGGTGLGLAIVKKLSDLMSGNIYVTSTQHEGSSFMLDIPIQMGTNNHLAIPHVSVEGKSVLIVDDNETNRAVLRSQLEQWGMVVTEADDPLAAYDLCQIHINEGFIPPYDIALLDMQMPNMDGAELGAKIRLMEHCDAMKMLMMTSLGSRNDAERFADIGFDAFFSKPTTTKHLLNALMVLFDDGAALSHAHPLVTKDYLGTLINADTLPIWPPKTRILLVEDNITNQIVALGMLDILGLTADTASNGLEALELMELALDIPYTIILMDCQMPEMDGYAASAAIRDGKVGVTYQTIPIVAMTANAMSGDRERCILSGMDDYITKPINLTILKKALKKWLNPVISTTEKLPLTLAVDKAPNTLQFFDFNDVLERLGGNQKLLDKVLYSFIDDTERLSTALNDVIIKNDLETVRLHAHTIKGSAANISAQKLQEIASRLELAAKEGNHDTLREYYSVLVSTLKSTLHAIRTYLK